MYLLDARFLQESGVGPSKKDAKRCAVRKILPEIIKSYEIVKPTGGFWTVSLDQLLNLIDIKN